MVPSLIELFGAAHKQLYVLKPDDRRTLVGAGDFAGNDIAAGFYLQMLTPRGGPPVSQYHDEVAGCVNSPGKGRAYLIGTLLGPAASPEKSDPRNKFLAAVLDRAAVKPDRADRLQRRRRVLGSKAAWFLCNTTHETVRETVSLEKVPLGERSVGSGGSGPQRAG